MNRIKLPALALLTLSLSLTACKKDASDTPSLTSNAGSSKKSTLNAPGLAVASANTHSVSLTVTAGSTGMPAGFSIQWISKAQYDQSGWPNDSTLCKASFSGNANGHFYNLGANQSVVVALGDVVYDVPGASASTNCGDYMICGTQYVFRAFAHANSSNNKSNMSANLTGATTACPTMDCSYSRGYWFNTGSGQSTHTWPGAITVGGYSYDEATGRAAFAALPNNNPLKQYFAQVGAILLSSYNTGVPAAVQADVDAINNYLSTLGAPLSASSTGSDAAANTAAGNISNWIDANHCF